VVVALLLPSALAANVSPEFRAVAEVPVLLAGLAASALAGRMPRTVATT
jgi:hypothetical protein